MCNVYILGILYNNFAEQVYMYNRNFTIFCQIQSVYIFWLTNTNHIGHDLCLKKNKKGKGWVEYIDWFIAITVSIAW